MLKSSDNPLFTIGIPTFNRASFLKESLHAAVSQTYPNLEIIVSDNASSDNTEAVVRSFGDPRIKYYRNETNLGGAANFMRTVDLASGQYFSWLQDDDLIFKDFATRAVRVMQEYSIDLYLGTAIHSPTVDSLHYPRLVGPPLSMNWTSAVPAPISPATIAGLSLLMSVAIPPVVAFATATLKGSIPTLRDSDCPLLKERILLVQAAGRVGGICDPVVSGFFRSHSQQAHVALMSEKGKYASDWRYMANLIDDHCVALGLETDDQICDCFQGMPIDALALFYIQSFTWPTSIAICNRVAKQMESAVRDRKLNISKPGTVRCSLQRLSNNYLPPILVRSLIRIFGRVSFD